MKLDQSEMFRFMKDRWCGDLDILRAATQTGPIDSVGRRTENEDGRTDDVGIT